MIRKDDRTPDQKQSHYWLIVGTDKCLSGWGDATGGNSVAAWACKPVHRHAVREWVEARSDMRRVRETASGLAGRQYSPKNCAHLHIYFVGDDHPALDSLRRTGQL